MGLGILSTVSGLIEASHVNDLIAAIKGAWVGRNSSGSPESGQSLGTQTYPWGPAYLTSIILNGTVVDSDSVTGKSNRIISGKVRTTSNQPDFIAANGAALSATIEATATDLALSINGDLVTVTNDIALTSLTAAPGSNNTCLVNDATLTDQESSKYIGEQQTTLTVGTVGSEISSRVGMIVALQKTTEIMFGLLETSTTFVEAFRGFFLDDSGDPLERETLADTDTLTLMELGWVFLQGNGSTTEVSYLTPIISGTEPTLDVAGGALAVKQYWYDLAADVWKRYSGSAWVSIDRMLIGLVVMDGTNCIASRSFDFAKTFDEYNSISVEINTVAIVRSNANANKISVYGVDVEYRYSPLKWTMPADLETGSEEANVPYYIYIGDKGERKLSRTGPYNRPELKGLYHPYNTWRCAGRVENVSSDFDSIVDLELPLRNNVEETFENKTLASPTMSGTVTGGTYSGATLSGDSNTITEVDSVKDLNGVATSGLVFKDLEIGDWNMDSGVAVSVAHGLTGSDWKKIRGILIIIRNDDDDEYRTDRFEATSGVKHIGADLITSTTINIGRLTGGYFDNAGYDATSFNRGWVTIIYEA